MNTNLLMHQAETWNRFSSDYEALAEPMTARFGTALADRMELPTGAAVLDIAAGSGALSLELARRGLRVTAIDHSTAMVARIAQRAAAEGLEVTARAMDGQALDLADDSFDAAISMFGIMMFPDHEAGLRELVRVLRPGGRAGLAVWQSEGGAGPALLLRQAALDLFPDRRLAPMPLGHQLWRAPEQLAASLTAAGLVDILITAMSEDWLFPSIDWVAETAPRLFGLMPIWTDADESERERLLDHIIGQLRAMERPAVPSPAWLAKARKP